MESTVLLLHLLDPRRLGDRIRALFSRLQRQFPRDARVLLGSLCEGVPYAGTSPKSRDEVWITADGQQLRIGEMPPEHLAHCLALIMRNLRQGKKAVINRETNQIKFVQFTRWPPTSKPSSFREDL